VYPGGALGPVGGVAGEQLRRAVEEGRLTVKLNRRRQNRSAGTKV
jgi:hypothetical protein